MLLMLIQGTFTDQLDREIALRMIESADEIDSLSLVRLADRCQCSAASIHKFCRKLGFDDFRTMKAQMILTMNVRRGQLEHHISATDEEQVLKRICSLSHGNMDRDVFISAAEEINRSIYRAPRVILLGAGYPEALTLHYQEDMIMMHKTAYAVPIGYRMSLPAQISDSAVMIISLTGRIADYFRQEFIGLSRKNPNMFMISGKTTFTSLPDTMRVLPLSVEGDNEDATTLLVEVMRYLKYMYCRRYGEM